MTDNEQSNSPPHVDDHFHRDSGHGHDLFMLRPVSQMEAAGGPADKVLLLVSLVVSIANIRGTGGRSCS